MRRIKNAKSSHIRQLVVIAGGSKGLGKALGLELAAKGEQRSLIMSERRFLSSIDTGGRCEFTGFGEDTKQFGCC